MDIYGNGVQGMLQYTPPRYAAAYPSAVCCTLPRAPKACTPVLYTVPDCCVFRVCAAFWSCEVHGEADAAGGDADDPPTDTHHDGASATELYLGDDDVSVTHMCIDTCVDMCVDMCIDTCIDTCVDMCVDLCTDMCIAGV